VIRREFIILLTPMILALPVLAEAQQPVLPVIGLLNGGTPEGDSFRVNAFRQGLSETGYFEGRNVIFEYRWAEGHYDRLPALVSDLIHRKVALIAPMFLTAALAAKAATPTIPIVFETGADPVKYGLVASLNRPGGNVTGISVLFNVTVQKQFEMLQEMVPTVGLIGLLVNPANANAESDTQEAQTAALALGKKIVVARASSEDELEAAFTTVVERQAGAMLIAADPFLRNHFDKLVALAARHRMPSLCPWRECAAAGGLMSYGANLADGYRSQGVYAGRILKGEKPADLPVQQSVKLDFVVNLKTAKTLHLDVPATLLARADEVIE
jgi:ABC-type uncharacterized transport system substrate-binding protein